MELLVDLKLCQSPAAGAIQMPNEHTTDLPFGDPDAARANLNDFIAIDGVLVDPRKNNATMGDRIIVGRKGSGKTLYLRALQDAAEQKGLLTSPGSVTINTDTVVFFLQRIREYVNTLDRGGEMAAYIDRRRTIISIWKTIWERSINICVLSLVLNNMQRSTSIDLPPALLNLGIKSLGDVQEYVIHQFSTLFQLPLTPLAPEACLTSISDHFESPRRLHAFLNEQRWHEFLFVLQNLCRIVPPIAIYIDAVDEDFEDAPEAWLTCQSGLYRAVLQSGFHHDTFSGRVHVVAALRDVVYSAALHGEHSDRQYQARQIKLLDWNPASVEQFLTEKLKRCVRKRSQRNKRADLDDLIHQWVGFTEVETGRRNIEPVSHYILRHGRMLPRDIIQFGNAISKEMEGRHTRGLEFESPSLRKAVSGVSEQIGKQAISVCINEILTASEYFPDYIISVQPGNFSLSDFRAYIENKIEKFFGLVKFDVVSLEKFRKSMITAELALEVEFDEPRSHYYRFDNILWRHGLLAVRETTGTVTRWRYNWRGAVSADTLPPGFNKFGFHPSLIDAFKIRPCAEGPVA